MKVYLAGGMRRSWRAVVKQLVPFCEYFDPTESGLTEELEYTTWDLDKIDRSDVVFIYFDKDNPSGLGLSLEAGYAYALGKFIIYVDEISQNPERARYCGMLRSVATVVVQNLDDGLSVLEKVYAGA